MEIKSNLQNVQTSLDSSAATDTRRTEATKSHVHGKSRIADGRSQFDADHVQLSATASQEVARAQKIEALEKAVASGTYHPKASDIASSLVDNAILDSGEPK